MAGVLTTSSDVTCGHSAGAVHGKAQVSSDVKLTVSGSPVLLKSGVDLKSVSGCPTPPASDTSGVTAAPCTQVTSTPTPPTGAAGPPTPGVGGGEATKLTCGGLPAMLDTLSGKTNGMVGKVSPQTLLSASAGQDKLTAV